MTRRGDMHQQDYDDMTPNQRDILAAMWGAETPETRLDRTIDRALKTAIAAVLTAIGIALFLIFIGD